MRWRAEIIGDLRAGRFASRRERYPSAVVRVFRWARPALLATALGLGILPAFGGAGSAFPSLLRAAPAPERSEPGQPADSVLGQWRPREYRLRDGGALPVDGRISFHRPGAAAAAGAAGDESGEWFVLFFVTDGEGEPLRGSAEGGQFRRDGDSLLLTHAYHLSGGGAVGPLAEAPLSLALRGEAEAAEGHREPCRVEVSGERMILFFPSGNSMAFDRVVFDRVGESAAGLR